MSVWVGYQRLMMAHPWKTQMCTAGLLAGAGDVVSQFVVERKRLTAYDPKRTVRFFALGSLFVAPVCQRWYIFLDKLKISGSARFAPFKKVVMDQVLFAPFCLSTFLVLLRGLEGQTMQQSTEFWRQKFSMIFANSLKLWPAVQVVNFYFVPLVYRIIFVQVIALFWNVYLAYATNSGSDDPALPLELPPL